ncbi:hypothetical protein J0H33_05975 [bacterium]|nr:hypothetical protein [bacterium]
MKVPVISIATRHTRQRTWPARPQRFVVRTESQAVQFARITDALDFRDTFGGSLFDEGNVRLDPYDPLSGRWVTDEAPVSAVTYHDV